MQSIKGQLTVRGILIGSAGCVVITAASAYTALKMGALPWPIVFAAIVSLFFLKALGRGKASLNEANVTHTVMSAGAMVAGGLAFTIPGIWMLGHADDVGVFEMLFVALSGVVLGLVCTAVLRRHFIEDAGLEYPIGEAAAQTLVAGNAGGKTGWKLFGSMGLAGLYTALRDGAGAIPAMLFGNAGIPGVAFGIYNSPMLLAVGFLVGTGAVAVWFAGALLANFGIVVGGSSAGLWDVASGQGIVSSLGMGVMMGAGVGVICKIVAAKAWQRAKDVRGAVAFGPGAANDGRASDDDAFPMGPGKTASDATRRARRLRAGGIAFAVAAVALALCFGLRLGPVPAVIVVLLAWVATAMSAQSVGQTGIDPMEIFGLIVLLAVAAVADVPQVQLFFVAGVVAVACGLAGDVMNDLHAGHVPARAVDRPGHRRRARCARRRRRHGRARERVRAAGVRAAGAVRVRAGIGGGDHGVRHPVGAGVRAGPDRRACALSCRLPRHDAGTGRLPALLHVFHGVSGRHGEGRLRCRLPASTRGPRPRGAGREGEGAGRVRPRRVERPFGRRVHRRRAGGLGRRGDRAGSVRRTTGRS